MMGEEQVLATAVHIDGLAQILDGHGAAFDMPSGSARTPRAFPGRLPGLLALPQRKVHDVFLALLYLDPGSGLQAVKVPAAQLTVVVVAPDPKVYVSICGVRVTFVDETPDHVPDLVHLTRGPGIGMGPGDVQGVHLVQVVVDVSLGELGYGNAELISGGYHLVRRRQ